MKLPNPSQNASQNINDPSTSKFDIRSFEITTRKGLSTSNTSPALNKLPIFSQNPFQESNIKQLCKLYASIRSFSVFNQILRRILGGRVLLILLILLSINQYSQNTRFFSPSLFILHPSFFINLAFQSITSFSAIVKLTFHTFNLRNLSRRFSSFRINVKPTLHIIHHYRGFSLVQSHLTHHHQVEVFQQV